MNYSFIPQMSPMNWILIMMKSIILYLMLLFIINSMPMNLYYNKNMKFNKLNKWTWQW